MCMCFAKVPLCAASVRDVNALCSSLPLLFSQGPGSMLQLESQLLCFPLNQSSLILQYICVSCIGTTKLQVESFCLIAALKQSEA